MYTIRFTKKGSNTVEELEIQGDFCLWRTEDGFAAEGWSPRKKGDELRVDKSTSPHHVLSDPYGLVAVTSSKEPEVPEP